MATSTSTVSLHNKCVLCVVSMSGEVVRRTPIQIEPFVQPTGPRVNIPSLAKEIFFLFFTSSVLEHIVEQSNKYAAECMGEQFQTWQPITVDELCAYFGFMGM